MILANLSARTRSGCELGVSAAGAWYVHLNTDSTAYWVILPTRAS